MIGVIVCFRVYSIVVVFDIRRMFYQVFVVFEDCGVFCYLWWLDGDFSKDFMNLLNIGVYFW